MQYPLKKRIWNSSKLLRQETLLKSGHELAEKGLCGCTVGFEFR